MKSGAFKKILMVFAGLFGLLLVAAVVIPLVVDVDQYRPQIQEAVNSRINGKLELGKLKLSLWGRIRVEVGGLVLTGHDGSKVVAVQDADFHLPFFPILTGSPVVTLRMKQPEVVVISDKEGRLNLMQLVKDVKNTSGTGAGATSAPSVAPTEEIQVPGIVASARFGVEMRDAQVSYRDLATALDTRLKDVNLVARDLSLSRPAEIELWGDLNTKMGKQMQVVGPARIQLKVAPGLKDGRLETFAGSIEVNLDDLEIVLPELFHKKKGMATNLKLAFESTRESASIPSMEAKFFNAVVNAKARVPNLAAPALALEMKSNDIDLGPWSELVPMLKEYELGGKARFEAKADGPLSKLGYSARLGVEAFTAKSPMLRAQPRIDADVRVVTDQIEKFLVTMKAPGNELKMEGKLVSFSQPRLEAAISGGLDLDQLVNLPPLGEEPKAAAKAPAKGGASAPATSGGATTPAADDYDAMIAPMRENPMMAAMTGVVDAKLTHFQVYGVRMTDVIARKSIRNLVVTLDPFSMKVFDGLVKATAVVDLKPARPTYRFSADVAGLELQKAVESQLKLFKNTVFGKASARIEGSGTSFNPEPAKKNLNAKGSLKVVDARFASIDVGRMASEAISKAMGRLSEKIPSLKGKSLKEPKSSESRYELISSDFTIAGGVFKSPNFVAKAAPNQGIDLTGSTSVGMIDYALDARWMVIDTYNLLKAKDIGVEQAGVKVDGILAEGNGPVKFPVVVGCTAMAPCYQYTEVPEYLAKIALGKASRGVQDKVKNEVTGKAKSEAGKKLKGLGKKLFGR